MPADMIITFRHEVERMELSLHAGGDEWLRGVSPFRACLLGSEFSLALVPLRARAFEDGPNLRRSLT